MSISDLDKKQIMKTLIRAVSHVSDIAYQKRVWIDGSGPECESFDDFVNYFLDEIAAILKKYKDFSITENQYGLLLKFSDEFSAFCDQNYDPREFIDTPEWGKIVGRAEEVLRVFNYHEI